MNAKSIISILITLTYIIPLGTVYGWTIKMDFNDGPLGLSVQDKGNSYYVFSDAAGDTIYSDCSGIEQDGHCARMSITKGDDGWGTWGGRIDFSDQGLSDLMLGTEVWISVKLYLPDNFDYTADPHLKFLRLHTTSALQQNEGYNDLYMKPDYSAYYYDPISGNNIDSPPFFFIKEIQDLIGYLGEKDVDRPKYGVWETYEMYLKLDYRSVSEGGTSRVRIWKNGKLLADFDKMRTLETKDSFADAFLIFTYWNGGRPDNSGDYPTKDQYLYIDDLIITTDTPSNKDVYGNSFIGDYTISPNPPIDVKVD